MPISQELLDILVCPATKVPVRMLRDNRLTRVNELISQGKLKDVDGNVVEQPLEEALITEDSKIIYRIDQGIPVMLIGSGIHTDQIENF